MRIVSVLNYKGGVGKTTITANLGADLARRGANVLLIDLDPQASLTFSFYPPSDWDPERTVYRWFESYIMSGSVKGLTDFMVTPPAVNKQLERGRLDLIGSDLRLVDVELDLAHGLGGARYQTFNPEYLKVYRMLADSLAALEKYDFVLIDCPPSFNMVTRTAIVASDHILVPAKADYLSTLGIAYLQARLTRLVEEYDLVAGASNTINPVILGVVFTMVQYAGANLMSKLCARARASSPTAARPESPWCSRRRSTRTWNTICSSSPPNSLPGSEFRSVIVPDRTADLLLRVAEFLRKLPADQLDALASGEARLEVVSKVPRAAKPVALKVSAEQINLDLKSLPDRASATQYLKDLKLQKAPLMELARQLDVPVVAKDAAAAVITKIVEQKVGHRLDVDAIYERR
jgi:chromosome partitioning protein